MPRNASRLVVFVRAGCEGWPRLPPGHGSHRACHGETHHQEGQSGNVIWRLVALKTYIIASFGVLTIDIKVERKLKCLTSFLMRPRVRQNRHSIAEIKRSSASATQKVKLHACLCQTKSFWVLIWSLVSLIHTRKQDALTY